ncbi:phage antirepressor KilAC domain-containing protein [Paraburkholderia sp. BR10937]|uniref:phage antirepressor KilAC domain-containing protein n=1 Tax=Paraburkholderia sp. BR10937 TaxID=3236994 RepID=UPI0034D2D0D9
MRSLERQANQLTELLRKLGFDEATVQRRVQRALDGARSREAKREAGRESVNRYVGCRPVTDVARELRMRRIDLFAHLRREGWLCRAPDGWRPTETSLNAGWTVLRGRGAVQWVQLTMEGEREIARRLGVAVRESPNE